MRLRELASKVRETINSDNDMVWVILYKNGRRWEYLRIYDLRSVETYGVILRVLEIDPNAVIFHGYDFSINTSNLDNIVAWLKYVYTQSSFRLSNEREAIEKTERSEEEMQLTKIAKETRPYITQEGNENIVLYKYRNVWNYLVTEEDMVTAIKTDELIDVIKKDPNAVVVNVTDIHVNINNVVVLGNYYRDIYSMDDYRISKKRVASNYYYSIETVAERVIANLKEPDIDNTWFVLYALPDDDLDWGYMFTNVFGNWCESSCEFNPQNLKHRDILLQILSQDPKAMLVPLTEIFMDIVNKCLYERDEIKQQHIEQYLLYLYGNQFNRLSSYENDIRNAPYYNWNDLETTNHTKLRRYMLDFGDYVSVGFLDDCGKCFLIGANRLDNVTDTRDIEQLKHVDYSNLDGCITAEECCYSLGLDPQKDVFSTTDILSCCENMVRF